MTDTILYGHVLSKLKEIESESVQCVITSPPYLGLRDYGLDSVIWDGDDACEHEWGVQSKKSLTGGNKSINAQGGVDGFKMKRQFKDVSQGNFCVKCGAWNGCLGLEPTPQLFVKHIVDIFREIHRILRRSGTVWINLGDSYANAGGKQQPHRDVNQGFNAVSGRGNQGYGQAAGNVVRPKSITSSIKPKDLIGIPWRVALALQDDGWYLRSDIIWHKPNPMPESVTDRPTKSHEYIFLLTKSPNYYYNADAIKEDAVTTEYDPRPHGVVRNREYEYESKENAMLGKHKNLQHDGQQPNTIHLRRAEGLPDLPPPDGKRNKRSVWTIATTPYPGAHFATYPPELVKTCLLAGTQPGDIVLDPFMGSGTTAMVAKRNDRHYIGIEGNESYKPLIEERIASALGPLFHDY